MNLSPRDTMSDQSPFILRDLGCVPYEEAFSLQKALQQEVIGWRDEQDGASKPFGYLLLLEHDPPVITVSRRKTARQHLVATAAMLDAAGVTVAETDRGGDITYHGPGQLVAYPILDLNRLGLRLHSYMRFLEDVVIDTLAEFGIAGLRDDAATGVWVDGKNVETSKRRNVNSAGRAGVSPAESPFASGSAGGSQPTDGDLELRQDTSKICAMGVRVSRWVSMHGLALNVTTNLDHFNLIVPCGLAGRGVTSMKQLLGDACPAMDDVKNALQTKMTERAASIVAGFEPDHALPG